MNREQKLRVKKEKTPRWWNDGALFRHHFAQSNYITAGWNWFMMLAGKAAEPFLFVSVLYSGYKLLPGVPQPSAGLDAGIFIGQQATLDIGGMGLMKLAQQANKPKGSFPYVVGIILVVLMILNVIVSSIERLVPLGNAGVVIEGILLVARAVMAVLYGHAIHSLKEDDQPVHGIVKTSDIYDWLDHHKQKVDTLSQQVDTLNIASTTLSTQLTIVGDTLSTLTGTLSSFASKLTRVDNVLAGVDSHLAQVETRQGEHFQQFESALTQVREIELTPLGEQVASINQFILSLGEILAQYNSRLYRVEESQGSRFNELHSSLRAIVVEVRQATVNELSRGLSPLVEQIGTIQAGALLPAPSRQTGNAGNGGENQRGNTSKRATTPQNGTTNQTTIREESKDSIRETRQGKIDTQTHTTRRLDTQVDHQERDLLDRESEEEDHQLDTRRVDTSSGKIINLANGTRLDNRTKQTDITAYILEFIQREQREPSLSEIMNNAGCAKQTAINARNAARETLQRREQEGSESDQAANS